MSTHSEPLWKAQLKAAHRLFEVRPQEGMGNGLWCNSPKIPLGTSELPMVAYGQMKRHARGSEHQASVYALGDPDPQLNVSYYWDIVNHGPGCFANDLTVEAGTYEKKPGASANARIVLCDDDRWYVEVLAGWQGPGWVSVEYGDAYWETHRAGL